METNYNPTNLNYIDDDFDITILETSKGVYSAYNNGKYLFKVRDPRVDGRYISNIRELQKARANVVLQKAMRFIRNGGLSDENHIGKRS